MGRVSFSVPVRSVRRPNSPWQGRCYVSCRVPLPPGALHASGGLSCARDGEAAEGAVGSSPSGVHGFLSAPASRAPGIWKDCAAALSAPDVSLLSPPRSPLSHPSPSQDWLSVPPPPAGARSPPDHSDRWLSRASPTCRVLGTPESPERKLCRRPPGGAGSELLRVWETPIPSWKGTALPLGRERKGRGRRTKNGPHCLSPQEPVLICGCPSPLVSRGVPARQE